MRPSPAVIAGRPPQMAGGGATVDVRVKPEAAENEQHRTQTLFVPGEPLWPFNAFFFASGGARLLRY